MSISMPLVFTGVQVRTLSRGSMTPSSSCPAIITVNHGKIDVVSTNNKFFPINIKVSDLTKPPRLPQSKTAYLVTLDFVHHSPLTFIEFETDSSKIEALVKGLSCAWPSEKTDNTSLFNDEANEIIRPVQKAHPNANPRPTNPPDRSARFPASRITMGDEENVTHQSVVSFGNHPAKAVHTAKKQQGMFADYGIGDKSSSYVPFVPVHRPSIVQKTMNKNVPFSIQVHLTDSTYRPVDSTRDKTTERRPGLNEIYQQPSILRELDPRIDFTDPNSPSHDVALIIEGQKTYVNKGILAVHSEFFNTLFYGPFAEKDKMEVDLNDVKRDEFIKMLNMIYPSYEKIADDNFESLLKLGDQFQIKIILDNVEQFLIESTKLNVTRKLNLSDRYRLVNLQDHCLDSLKTIQDIMDLKDIDGYNELTNNILGPLLKKLMKLK